MTAHTHDRRNSSFKQILRDNPNGIATYWHILDASLPAPQWVWAFYESDESGDIGDEVNLDWAAVSGAASYNVYIDAGIYLLAGRTNKTSITLTYTGYEGLAISAVTAAEEEGLKIKFTLDGGEDITF